MSQQVSLFIAFLAGLATFFTPCVLPLIPVYISFISGLSLEELTTDKGAKNSRRVMVNIVLFILGFSFIFITLGASASTIGKVIIKNQKVLRIIGGAVIILFGLHILGLFKIRFLEQEKRIQLKARPVHGLGSFIVGVAFAIGWTPCIGPILGSILTFAAAQDTLNKGVLLLASYSLGMALPFFLTGLAVHKFLNIFNKFKKYFKIASAITGGLLIIAGLSLLTGWFL